MSDDLDAASLRSTVEALQAERDQAKRDYDTLALVAKEAHAAWSSARARADAAKDKYASLDRACGDACRALNVEEVMWS